MNYLEGKNLAFYQSLPQSVEIHRGCSIERKRGLSWTTDPKVAADFATGHRGIRVPNAVIARTIIPKDQILSVITDRQECEVIIDYRCLGDITMSWHVPEQT